MVRSIMVPLDGSTFSEHALPLALSIARRADAGVRLMHVHSPVADATPEGVPILLDESVQVHLRSQQRDYLDSVISRVREVSSVAVTHELLEGGVTESIRLAVQATDTDLVVMTTHGRSALGRFWLGSVADTLLRELTVPLILVRPHEARIDLKKEPVLKHILLPLDGTVLAEQMIEPAVALGQLMDADYTLLRVVKPPAPVAFHFEGASVGEQAQSVINQINRIQKQLEQEAAAYLEGVAKRLRERSLRVQMKVMVEQQPAVAILHAAMKPSVELIALETHGRRGLSRLFLGSVADKVIRGATMPILVQRPVF